jgi:hypothetical protein
MWRSHDYERVGNWKSNSVMVRHTGIQRQICVPVCMKLGFGSVMTSRSKECLFGPGEPAQIRLDRTNVGTRSHRLRCDRGRRGSDDRKYGTTPQSPEKKATIGDHQHKNYNPEPYPHIHPDTAVELPVPTMIGETHNQR